MAYLEGPSVKQAEVIKQELGEESGELENGVRDLRTMCAANPYLPQADALETAVLQVFLRGCRMDFERARNKLELYCTARSRHRDLFDHRILKSPSIVDVHKFMDIIPLPKLTDEGHRITIFRITSEYPDNIDMTSVVRAILLTADVRLREETLIAGDVFIWELSQIRMSFTTRLAAGMSAVRRAIYLAQAAYPQRLRRIHVLGIPPALASYFNFIRSLVNEKIRQRYILHNKTDELLDYYPTRVLPSEWGGEEESMEMLSRKWRSLVDTHRDYISNLNNLCQDASDTKCNSDIYGVVGSFRKLDLD